MCSLTYVLDYPQVAREIWDPFCRGESLDIFSLLEKESDDKIFGKSIMIYSALQKFLNKM